MSQHLVAIMPDQPFMPLDDFKERELEILAMMADGLSNQEIAEQLFISKTTVRWYNKQIYSKLGTSRRTEAIARARDLGLIGDSTTESIATQTLQHHFPITTGPFIGRDDELAELADLLHNPDIRLLSIIAAGGMGKSRLSLELGHLVKNNYEHGATFIDLTPVRNPNDIAQFAASSLGLTISGQQSPQNTLFNYCREKELLLIFDNFEHVLSGASLLSDIAEVAPRVTIIATSRERLKLRIETVFNLYPVDKSGGKLFVEVAAMMRPNIVIGEDEQAHIQRIVELVGGLPLGLILAATWVDTLSIPEIADEIEASLDFLSADMSDMPERQRSIHAVIDPTWKRLSEPEQHAFMWASVFRGGFTREAFQQVTGASVHTIQTLLSRSLMSHGYARRYDMHPLLRQYAREKLESHGMLAAAKQAHLETFLTYTQHQNERMYDGQHYLEALDALDLEQDNFRAALDWSFSGHDVEDGVSLVLNLCDFWSIRSQVIEAVYYLEQARNHQHEAALYHRLGQFQLRLGKRDIAEEHYQNAIALANETNQQDILAKTYRSLGDLHIHTKSEETRQLYEQALAISQALNIPREVAACHVVLGLLEAEEGKLNRALDYNHQAMEMYEKLGDIRGTSIVIYNTALVYYRQGNRQRAKAYCEHSLSLKRQIGDKAGVARRLSVLAGMIIAEEDFERAIAYIAESRAICQEIGDQKRLGEVFSKEGFIYLIMNEYSQAQAILEKGLRIAQSLEDYRNIVEMKSYLAMLHLVQGQVQSAKPHVLDAIEANEISIYTSWLPVVVYANYLWYAGEFDACLPLVTVLSHHAEQHKGSDNPDDEYFLKPLIYRVQQHGGAEAWQDALVATSGITVEQMFHEMVNTLQL